MMGSEVSAACSIVEIAMVCGFSDQSSFNRTFRRHYRVSPGEHRRTGPAVANAETLPKQP